jgi:hypothetical protein
VTQSALADASDASAASITRAVVAGDGSSSRAWTGGTGITLTYKKAGTFTPHVLLTDKFGNVTDKSLGAIHVYTDTTKPKVKIITPAAPARIASWKVIRGTTSDIGSGVLQAACLVIEKRGTVWYLYNFTEKRWVKGYASMTRTLNSSVPARHCHGRLAHAGDPRTFQGNAACRGQGARRWVQRRQRSENHPRYPLNQAQKPGSRRRT